MAARISTAAPKLDIDYSKRTAIATKETSEAANGMRSPVRPPISRGASTSSYKSGPTTPLAGPPPVGGQLDRVISQPNTSAVIDMETFQQILELDDDEEHEYSKELVDAFFAQARTAFRDMDKAYAKKDLPDLSSLGHFLKGSSAALGITRVSLCCQKIEHYGKLRDESVNKELSKEDALSRIHTLLADVKKESTTAQHWLEKWYKDDGAS